MARRSRGSSPPRRILASSPWSSVRARCHGGPRPAGHVALEVITRVNKPVVVVPPDGTTRARIARVLIPLDGTDESSQAIADTIALARRRDVEFVVLHVHAPETVPAFEDQPHHETSRSSSASASPPTELWPWLATGRPTSSRSAGTRTSPPGARGSSARRSYTASFPCCSSPRPWPGDENAGRSSTPEARAGPTSRRPGEIAALQRLETRAGGAHLTALGLISSRS